MPRRSQPSCTSGKRTRRSRAASSASSSLAARTSSTTALDASISSSSCSLLLGHAEPRGDRFSTHDRGGWRRRRVHRAAPRPRQAARARPPPPWQGSTSCTCCRCRRGRDHCVRAWPLWSAPSSRGGRILCTETCWPTPHSTSCCSPVDRDLADTARGAGMRAVQRRCSFRSLSAQAAWPALPARARARPALQLLLCGRWLPVAGDAAVAALPRPPRSILPRSWC